MNIHTPERYPDESRSDYKARRATSRAAVKAMRLVGLSGKVSTRQALRDAQRQNGTLRSGVYGQGLRAQFARNALAAYRVRLQKRMAALAG